MAKFKPGDAVRIICPIPNKSPSNGIILFPINEYNLVGRGARIVCIISEDNVAAFLDTTLAPWYELDVQGFGTTSPRGKLLACPECCLEPLLDARKWFDANIFLEREKEGVIVR